ncbi:CocE/NonD family hydrolase [Nocardioides coralli]|uniref:CocE/NonD family hydrolase n=1 Tax=Nocardioides coralli TaxID=2872154 RepID=UPI001CA44642|nr:CocE/NonD family hydrolase [Nocardioides coralli]QZY28253.1 CocE/NonD family hydrolase [Nocardioides coralli]
MRPTRIVALLLGALVTALLTTAPGGAAPGAAAEGTESYEVHYVPTVGDAVIRVEVWRDTAHDAAGQPVLLTYSPYNSIGEPDPARDSLGRDYVPRGYARAVADVIGTRGSTGCWDYGGRAEQQSGVDVVKWLADRGWSNGRVGMIGGSYNGTTASMVAARGRDVPELKAIVPIAAISRWYGYAYGNGVRYLLNSEQPTDEGFDTPLAFDLGFGKTVAADPMGQTFADTVRARAAECGTVEHTEAGYDRNPDYDGFWRERDYRRHADDFRAAVLLAHGWQDFNVKQEEGTELWRDIPVDRPGTARTEGVPFKLMYLTQGKHSGGTNGPQWDSLLQRFLDHTLLGRQTGIRSEGPVITQGETSEGVTDFRTLADYPAPATRPTRLWLRPDGTLAGSPSGQQHVASYLETGTSTEEATPGLLYRSQPADARTRVVGSPVLDARLRVSAETMHLTPVLYDEAPDGSRKVVARGFQHLDYRKSLRTADPAPGKWVRARVQLLPVDYTLATGHRFVLAVQSSNTVWAVPGNPGTVEVRDGRKGSSLRLPTL